MPCLARHAYSVVLVGRPSSAGGTWPTVPSGAISVMPHAWTIAQRRARSKRAIIDSGTAEPPTSMRGCSTDRTCPGWLEVLQHAHPDRRHAAGEGDALALEQIDEARAGRDAGPGNTSFAPTIIAANGKPQALAWNIGTTGSTASRSRESPCTST